MPASSGTTVTVGGVNYVVPDYNSTGWAQGSGNLSQLLIALAAVTASTPSFMQQVAVTSSPQSVLSGKTYLVDTTSIAITLTLPAAAANAWFIVKDVGGNSETNNITIARVGSETIDGLAGNLPLIANYGQWGFMSNGTNWFLFITT